MGLVAALVALGAPAAAFALWPLLRGGDTSQSQAAGDPREPLLERKRQLLAALRELAFEHDAGHISEEDYEALRARYEQDAAAVLAALDRLPPREPAARPREPRAPARGWRHPAALLGGAAALVAFGVLLGAGIVRYSQPEPTNAMPAPGSRPPAWQDAPAAGTGASGGGRVPPPEVLRGMLQAARQSLFAGRYGEAIAAYQAVLKRDPDNVDALTHLGLIVALGGHADAALETFDRALKLDPNYPPALLYRGQVLYESKRDAAGAVRSWEKFLRVVPSGADHERVERMIAEAKRAR